MYRIRSSKNKSAPKFQSSNKNIDQNVNTHANPPTKYQCLKEYLSNEEYWKYLLNNQLDMASTVVAFQNEQISMRVQAHKKLMLRETFMLKKQIIRMIMNQKFEQVLVKLQILKKTSTSDAGLVNMFIDFYHIRETIMGRKMNYDHKAIKSIKKKMGENSKLQKQKSSIIYGRIAYILALHLVKLDGVLIHNEDVGIVAQALNMKKKQLCMLGSEINQKTLQSLLFVTFQFYRILYLLKRDQDLMTQYYNQIRAYISIFKTKCSGFQKLQNTLKIQQRIEKMKPLNLNLKIYDDHTRRRVLSLQNTQYQLLKNHYTMRNNNALSSQISTEMSIKKSVRKVSKNIQVESEDEHKNEISGVKQQDSSKNIEQEHFNYNKIQNLKISDNDNNKFCFQFVKPDLNGILKGQFISNLNEDLSKFNIVIKIFGPFSMIGYYQTPQIDIPKKGSLSSFGKVLWKAIKQRFYRDKSEFLPSLFSFQYPPQSDLPKAINVTCQLPISVRIHQILLYYLKKQSKIRKMNGQILQFPDEKHEISKLGREKSHAEQKIFAKRHGFIAFNKKVKTLMHKIHSYSTNQYQKQPEEELKIQFFMKQEEQFPHIYLYFLEQNLKDYTILYKNEIHNNKTAFLGSASKLNDVKFIKIAKNILRNTKNKIKFIEFVQSHHDNEVEYFTLPPSADFHQNNYINASIEQEFEVMKSPILESIQKAIKVYRHKQSNYKQTKKQQRKIFKIQNQYIWFYQQINQNYLRYFDIRQQFFINKTNSSYSHQITKKKFRLYKLMHFRNKSKQNEYCRLMSVISGNSQFLRKKTQTINVQCLRTYTLKMNNKYFHLNIFLVSQNYKNILTLYDFLLSQNYIGALKTDNICLKNPWSFNQNTLILNESCQMKKFSTVRTNICDIEDLVAKVHIRSQTESSINSQQV